jgi:hypothetical protein
MEVELLNIIITNLPAAIIGIFLLSCFLMRDKLFDYFSNTMNSKIHTKLDSIAADVATIKQHDARQDLQIKGIELDALRRTVHDARIPIEERLAAGIRYLNQGGNGGTKRFIEGALVPENEQLYKTLQTVIGVNLWESTEKSPTNQ